MPDRDPGAGPTLVCVDWNGQEIRGCFSYCAVSFQLGRMVDGVEVWEERRLRGFRYA